MANGISHAFILSTICFGVDISKTTLTKKKNSRHSLLLLNFKKPQFKAIKLICNAFEACCIQNQSNTALFAIVSKTMKQ